MYGYNLGVTEFLGTSEGYVYEIRQDTAFWLTPMLKHQIFNTGNTPLRYVVLMTTGGLAPEGGLSWSAITQRGVVVDKPEIGSGQATTRVFDEHSNPSLQEGLHLTIRDISLRKLLVDTENTTPICEIVKPLLRVTLNPQILTYLDRCVNDVGPYGT